MTKIFSSDGKEVALKGIKWFGFQKWPEHG
jgi:hypothetical protein